MRLETACPECGKPITLGRVMTSRTPLHVRCPSCKTRIQPDAVTTWVVLIAGVLTGLAIVKWLFSPWHLTTKIIVAALIVLVELELVLSLVVVNFAKLSPRKPPG